MSQLETMIRDAATPDAWTADWDDVLRRAGRSGPERSRRTAAVAAVAAAALVLTLPAIGVGGDLKDLIAGSSGPGLELRAALTLPGGASAGALTLRTSRIFVAVAPRTGRLKPRPFRPAGAPLEPQRFRWTLGLAGSGTADSARISGVAKLCAPCSDGAHGKLTVGRKRLSEVFGRAAVVVRTSAGTARGTLRLVPPNR
jgi:hypothetical protein